MILIVKRKTIEPKLVYNLFKKKGSYGLLQAVHVYNCTQIVSDSYGNIYKKHNLGKEYRFDWAKTIISLDFRKDFNIIGNYD